MGAEETQAGQGLLERGQRVPSCGCGRCHGDRGTGCGDLKVRRAPRMPPEDPSLSGVCLTVTRPGCSPMWGKDDLGKQAKPPGERRGERVSPPPLEEHTAADPQPAGSGEAKLSSLPARCPSGSGNKSSVPLPHCPPNLAAAIAAATMPKRKKQNQQQQQLPQQPALSDRDEPGDEEDESPIGPPSLLGPPPMANGKPGDPKSALHRVPPGSRAPVIPPLLSLPPPPRGRGPIRGGLGPRCSPYGRGWWGVNTEPPFPRPGYGAPFRESFHTEPRNPRRLKSWSFAKNICPPKDSPHMLEDKSDRPVCRHFSKKGHCRYEDLCAFYHPGVNGPPL